MSRAIWSRKLLEQLVLDPKVVGRSFMLIVKELQRQRQQLVDADDLFTTDAIDFPQVLVREHAGAV